MKKWVIGFVIVILFIIGLIYFNQPEGTIPSTPPTLEQITLVCESSCKLNDNSSFCCADRKILEDSKFRTLKFSDLNLSCDIDCSETSVRNQQQKS